MNNKGFGAGLIIMIAVGVIVTLVIMQTIATNVGTSTATTTITNVTYTLSATSNYTDIPGCQEVIGSYVIYNASASSGGIPTTAVDLQEYVGTDGLKTVGFFRGSANYSGQNVNATYVCGNDGYIDNTGAVAVTGLILIFAAIAIMVFAMIPVLRDKMLGF